MEGDLICKSNHKDPQADEGFELKNIRFRKFHPVIFELNLAFFCFFLKLLWIFSSIICPSPY